MRIVIVGSGGRLGAALRRIYAAEHEIVGFNHAALDLASPESIRSRIEPLSFDVLINCAALTNVDYCETHSQEAFRINAHAVRELAQICTGKGVRMIHIGTDYVFDGLKRTPYTEEDPAIPISVYGESKLQGEMEMLEVSDRHLAVRVSWVFGPDRPSFVDGVLQRALEKDVAQAVADKISAPTYTLDAAEYLRPLLAPDALGGILHLCNSGSCSWQEYGQVALDCALAAGVPLKATKVEPIRMVDLDNFIAKRPVYTVLGTDRLAGILGKPPRPWQQAVEEYVRTHWAPAHL